MVGLATLIAGPIGIGVAIYLTEYGRDSRFASAVRYFVDVMTGVPSIVFGLFIYITLVVTEVGGSGFAGWKGAVALALLALPIVTRSAEVVLELVPDSLREAGLALGAPRWRVIMRVVLPAAAPGILTGVLLAVARAAGETAPLLFTATIVKASTFDLQAPMNSLPAQIFADVGQAQDRLVERAWGAALALVMLILIFTILCTTACQEEPAEMSSKPIDSMPLLRATDCDSPHPQARCPAPSPNPVAPDARSSWTTSTRSMATPRR